MALGLVTEPGREHHVGALRRQPRRGVRSAAARRLEAWRDHAVAALGRQRLAREERVPVGRAQYGYHGSTYSGQRGARAVLMERLQRPAVRADEALVAAQVTEDFADREER